MTAWSKHFCCGQRHRAPATQAFENVLNGLDKRSAITDQLMAATRPRVVDGTGHGVHLAPLLCGETGSNQRAAGHAGLDHQHAKGQTADDWVL